MANGNGSLANAWDGFDAETKLRLTITELDRLYARLSEMQRLSTEDHSHIRREITNTVATIKADFTERVGILRAELEASVAEIRADMRDGFEKMEKRQNRSIGLLYTMIGGIVVGLVLLVVQLAPH